MYADCIINIMLAVIGMPSIVFYASAAALGLVFATVFFVALFKKKRIRQASDVTAFVFGSLIMVIALITGAFAIINKYNIFGLSAAADGTELMFSYGDKTLFSVPFIGYAVTLFNKLALAGVIIPFALFAVCFTSCITLGIKTFCPKKVKGSCEHTETQSEENPTAETSKIEQSVLSEENVEETEEPAITGYEPDAELPPPEPERISSQSVQNIFDEIDKLVTVGPESEEHSNIDDRLRKAIEEGYALKDSIEYSESYQVEETDEHSNEIPSEQKDAEEVSAEIVSESQLTVKPDRKIGETIFIDETEKIEEAPIRKITPASAEDAERYTARVRTIVRRATAKSIEDIEKRADAAEAEQNKKDEPFYGKRVEAQSGGLPLTRKYIILNRRNAATVFNDYLNSKRQNEKDELTGSLNTIIMK